MATKPGTIPEIWAKSNTYTTGPFVGQPNLSIPAGAVSLDGHRPGAADPTPAEYQNYQQHWGSRWIVDWLADGLAVPGANTHIVETDSDGRTGIIGLDITDVVDRTVSTIVAANTLVPAVILRTDGNGFQVENAGAGVGCFTADMSGGSAIGYTAVDGAADAAQLFSVILQGSGGLGSMTCTNAAASGLSMSLTSSSSDTMTLTNGGTGAPLRLTPQVPPGAPVGGQIWTDTLNDDLEFVSNSGSTQRVWSSEQGYSYTYSETATAQAAGATYLSFAYGFVTGKRYVIRYGFDFGRVLGSTWDAIDYFNVGGIGFPLWFGAQLALFQGGPNEIERSRCKEWEFVSPVTGIFTVDLLIGQSGGGGATVQIENGFISVLGALD